MAQYTVTVPIIVTPDGNFYPDIPPVALDGETEGLIYDDGGEQRGGFEGYAEGELTRILGLIRSGVTEGITATIVMHTSPEKMVKWHNDGWTDSKGIKKAFKTKELVNEKAKKEKDKLEGFEIG